MIQIVQAIGEIVDKNNSDVIVQVHTYYATYSDLVVKNALVVCKPTKYVTGPSFDNLEKGNLVFVQGRLIGGDFGNPFISPEGEGIFTLKVSDVQLLSKVAPEDRGSDKFQIIMVGNLGRDPETSYTPNGKEVVTAFVAANHKSGDYEETTWFKVESWKSNKLALMRKGMRLFLVGHLMFDPKTGGPAVWYTQAGEPRSNYTINLQRLIPFAKLEDEQYEDIVSSDDDDPSNIPF